MKTRDFWISFASVAGTLLLWECAGALGWIDVRFFPRPTTVAARFAQLLTEPGFAGDLGVSLARVFAGAAIALPLALALALAGELSPAAGAVLRPWVAFLYPLPKLAVFPLVLVLLGLGEASKIALVAFGVFFLVLLSAGQGIRRIRRSEFYDVAVVYKLSFRRKIFQVLLRGAMPEILGGTKLGLGYGLVLVIAAEFMASSRGIGVFLWNAWDQFRVVDLYAGLAAVSLVGWLIFFAFGVAEARYSRYD